MDSFLRTDAEPVTPSRQPGAIGAPQPAGPAALRRLTSEQLLAGADEVLIRHGAVDYRLRRTSLDKLILTK